MTSKRFQLESNYSRTLLPLARLWRQAADRALSGMGVSAASGWALVQLGRLGDDARQTDLARELDVTGASLVRVVDQLVAATLVNRRPDEIDGRVTRVYLTQKGLDLFAEIERVFADLRKDMLIGVSDSDLAIAIDVAERLAARFTRQRIVK
ncbi:MarR family transcriptional regulator (plasmid) [Sphingomonas paeninsulae]|jgi:MarR family transcriptional regulator for hemolysin|uniref:MarR family transcriptional regulator n=1 Tax=Sphingomonas paeninsulae TaxID=2319844 RepID=A0A494TJR7_SPHPE|nr:MarR family transcriptional regulator [Sphingomonas paeninsulae]AYJ85365.1 MarR family transcriptional regulator [Sphingomonas paeninsulae]